MTSETDMQVLIRLRELWHQIGGAATDSYRDEDDRPNSLYRSDGGIILETNADYPMRLLTPAGMYHVVTKGDIPDVEPVREFARLLRRHVAVRVVRPHLSFQGQIQHPTWATGPVYEIVSLDTPTFAC